MPGSGPGRTVRRAGAVVLAASGVVLLVAGLQVCPLIARPLSELMSLVMPPPNFSCPATRPPELWWTAAFMQLGALLLWLPPQRGRLLWRRPFLRLMTRRRIGSVAGTLLMAGGASLVLAALVAVVLGTPPGDLLAGLSWSPSVAVVGGTGLAAIWWGAAETENAGQKSRERLVFLLASAAGMGLMITLMGDLIGIGWPGFGLRQLGLTSVFVLTLIGGYALERGRLIERIPLGPASRMLAGGATIVLATWGALTTRLPTLCYGYSCTGDPLVSPRLAIPLAAVGLYLMATQYRRHENLRAAYRDETQFVPISTI